MRTNARIAHLCSLLVPLVLVLGSCAALEQVLRPRAEVLDLRVQDLGLDASTLVFDVRVVNPYGVGLPLLDLAYSVASEGRPVFAGQVDVEGSVPAHASRVIEVPVRVVHRELLDLLGGLAPGVVVPYDAGLEVFVDSPVAGRLGFSLQEQGTLPVPALPKVGLAAIRLDELGLTGAKGTIELDIENPNAFPFGLDVLSYGLTLAGQRVLDGTVDPQISFDRGATDRLSLPVSLSAGALGSGLLSILRGADAAYELDGDLRLSTPWGPLVSSFASSGRTAVRSGR